MTDSDNSEGDLQDLLVDLDFAPSWAKGEGGADASAVRIHKERERSAGGRRKPKPGPRRHDGRDGGGRRDGGARRDGGGRRDGERGHGGRSGRDHFQRPHREEIDISDLEVGFLPERSGLAPLAQRLRATGCVYSLFEISAMFLRKPEFYAIRIATLPVGDAPAGLLHQCTACKSLFSTAAEAEAHASDKHLEDYYDRERVEGIEPKGNFVTVSRCKLSGEVLGPPNYHTFNDNVAELHRRRFAHMSLDAYRKSIENVRDPELIEKWKQETSRPYVYRTAAAVLKAGEEAREFPRYSDAQADFANRHLPNLVRAANRFIVPGSVARKLDDRRLRRAVEVAYQREQRFPLKLSLALRPAFRRLGLWSFKTRNGMTFVAPVVPNALDPSTVTEEIRELLLHVTANPGCARSELAPALRPDAADDSPEVMEIMARLRWLIDRGHMLEFSDGKLSVPRGSSAGAGRR